MINVLICGISGQMGEKVYLSAKNTNLNVLCGVDKTVEGDFNCPVYHSFDEVRENIDVIIDFSVPDMLENVLQFAVENKCCLVEATTGFSEKQKQMIKDAATKIPVFLSVNMSLGINLLLKLCLETAKTLVGYDIEIIEKHHALKADAPSGTTLLIANEINEILGGDRKIICGRSGTTMKRHNEICVHSIRGGNIVGEHEIMFIGENETITIKHETQNKILFAEGACKVAEFIHNKPIGLYTMKNYFND